MLLCTLLIFNQVVRVAQAGSQRRDMKHCMQALLQGSESKFWSVKQKTGFKEPCWLKSVFVCKSLYARLRRSTEILQYHLIYIFISFISFIPVMTKPMRPLLWLQKPPHTHASNKLVLEPKNHYTIHVRAIHSLILPKTKEEKLSTSLA